MTCPIPMYRASAPAMIPTTPPAIEDQAAPGQLCCNEQDHEQDDCCQRNLQEPVHLQGTDEKPQGKDPPDCKKYRKFNRLRPLGKAEHRAA